MKITEINIFPIKSLGGFSVEEAIVESRGLQYDRRFMLADTNGRFVSQREISAMTGLGTAISGETLTVFSKKNPGEKIEVPLQPDTRNFERMPVTVFKSGCTAAVMPAEFSRWFSQKLDNDLRLVYMDDAALRPANPEYAPGFHVSFADGYPILLLGEASLADLNSRLDVPVPMNRFRPNLVFDGGMPHEEDTFRELRIGGMRFRGVKPCGRCIIPTTDQDSGFRGAEPLRTLGTYRLQGKSINFGENLVALETGGRLRVGDFIEVLERKSAPAL